MNTNPTAISLAVITHNLTALYELGAQTRDRRNAFLTGLDAVQEIANKNGNSMRSIREIERTLAIGRDVTL